LKKFCEINKTTAFPVLLTILFELLSRICGNENDICIGTVISGRKNKNEEKIFGYFNEIIPISFSPIGKENSTFFELFKEISNIYFESTSRSIPIQKLASFEKFKIQNGNEMKIHPIFQIMSLYQVEDKIINQGKWENQKNNQIDFEGIQNLPFLGQEMRKQNLEIDLMIYFGESNSSSRENENTEKIDQFISISFKIDLFLKETIESIGNCFLFILEESLSKYFGNQQEKNNLQEENQNKNFKLNEIPFLSNEKIKNSIQSNKIHFSKKGKEIGFTL